MKELVILKAGENSPLEKLWYEKASAIMSNVHPNRLIEWVNGRVALTLAFERMGMRITPEASFEGYQTIKEFPDYTFSISHTHGWAGALLVEGKVHTGLDIEKNDRVINQKIFERFSHEADEKLDRLLLWSAKEAAYKTLPASIQEKIWLQHIQIGPGTFSGNGFSGSWEQVKHGELIIVEAFRAK